MDYTPIYTGTRQVHVINAGSIHDMSVNLKLKPQRPAIFGRNKQQSTPFRIPTVKYTSSIPKDTRGHPQSKIWQQCTGQMSISKNYQSTPLPSTAYILYGLPPNSNWSAILIQFRGCTWPLTTFSFGGIPENVANLH
jgi:hypothetical protein